MCRQIKDHERYLRNREERLSKQKDYYRSHREWCLGYRNRRISKENGSERN